MAQFNAVKPLIIKPGYRVDINQITPLAVKPSHFAQTNLSNIETDILGPFTVGNGNSTSFSTIASNDKGYRIGELPYMIVFFESIYNVNNIIGYGKTGWKINGPFSIPELYTDASSDVNGDFVEGGNNGNNLVYITELVNNTGGSKDIYCAIGARIMAPVGGSVE